jgi:hypothetical protein
MLLLPRPSPSSRCTRRPRKTCRARSTTCAACSRSRCTSSKRRTATKNNILVTHPAGATGGGRAARCLLRPSRLRSHPRVMKCQRMSARAQGKTARMRIFSSLVPFSSSCLFFCLFLNQFFKSLPHFACTAKSRVCVFQRGARHFKSVVYMPIRCRKRKLIALYPVSNGSTIIAEHEFFSRGRKLKWGAPA